MTKLETVMAAKKTISKILSNTRLTCNENWVTDGGLILSRTCFHSMAEFSLASASAFLISFLSMAELTRSIRCDINGSHSLSSTEKYYKK